MWVDEKTWKIKRGYGYPTLCMQLIPPHCTLKVMKNVKFKVLYNLQQEKYVKISQTFLNCK